MPNRSREFAKFFSGIAAHETVGHWWLGIWGQDFFPIKLSWLTFTEEWNYVAMSLWPIILAALVYYAWIRTAPRAQAASAPHGA